jgi:Domain of unknown function (DUF4249)
MRYCVIVLLVIFFTSCEKNVDLNLKSAEPVLVVDAQIEDGQPPVVVLTKSLGFFSNINAQILANAFVHNADVYVSNGTLTHKLREYPLQLAPGLTAFFYSNDLLTPATMFMGQLNKGYTLRIVSEGQEYTSNTFIPNNDLKLDSIWVKPVPFSVDTLKRNLNFRGTDPIGLGNSGRYFTKKNSEQYLPGENSVFDDQVIDGQSFNSQIPQGIDRNDKKTGEDIFFTKGDTITLKWCNINRATYTFWNTWEFAFQSIGNPFAQPNKVLGNISNGALGAFCGYAVKTKTVIAR